LTLENDKLSAIAGLAQFFHRYTGAHYMAGLWEEDLHNSLLWSTCHREVKRPLAPRAPTWSWASLDARVNFEDPTETRERSGFQISNIKFEATYFGSDIFGRIESAGLTLDGLLQPIRLRTFSRNEAVVYKITDGSSRVLDGRAYIDEMDKAEDLISEGSELYGLSLFEAFVSTLMKCLWTLCFYRGLRNH
jgi:hypothetical protein